MSVEQREKEQARAQEKRRNFSEGQGKKEGGRSREKRQRSSEEQREKETKRGREKMRRISDEQRQRDTKRKRENRRRSNSTQSKEKEEEVSNFNFSFTVNNLKTLMLLFLVFMTFVKRKQFQLFFLSNHHTSLFKLSKQEQVLLLFGHSEPPEVFLPSPPPEGEFFVLLPFTTLSNFIPKIAAMWFTPKYSRRQFHVVRWKRSLFKRLVERRASKEWSAQISQCNGEEIYLLRGKLVDLSIRRTSGHVPFEWF